VAHLHLRQYIEFIFCEFNDIFAKRWRSNVVCLEQVISLSMALSFSLFNLLFQCYPLKVLIRRMAVVLFHFHCIILIIFSRHFASFGLNMYLNSDIPGNQYCYYKVWNFLIVFDKNDFFQSLMFENNGSDFNL